MNILNDPSFRLFIGIILVLLTVSSLIGFALSRRSWSESGLAVIRNLNARIRAWWIMIAVFLGAILCGMIGIVLLFTLMSFLALREFITITPTSRGDHRALFWVFFIITPAQYYFVWVEWYGFYSIFIPVYGFLWLSARSALEGQTQDFLARTAKIQWAVLICVYFLSHAPALLLLEIPGFENQNAKLLCFLVCVAQSSDVFQYIWGKTCGRNKIVPLVSPSKTVEGFVGGVASAVALGTSLWWMTPFLPWQAALLSLAICVMGFLGGLVMSAIKRDRGVKDFGAIIEGHGGMLDRVDSLCFSAPVFFHLVRYSFT